jgi:hypothetical protein
MKTSYLVFLGMLLAILALAPQSISAQYIPCKIVNLILAPLSVIQAGQSFELTSNLTASCDPSVLPIIRVDLIDPATSKILSTASVPYYTYSSSFTVSVVNHATAREVPGSWPLQIQAYVISGINGQSVASSSQLFQVDVEPYTLPVTEMQTTQTTTQSSNITTLSSQLSPPTTTQEAITQSVSSTQIPLNTQPTGNPVSDYVLPVVIVLVGLAAFGLLVFGGRRGSKPIPKAGIYCKQCGVELSPNENYCTNCGTKRMQ